LTGRLTQQIGKDAFLLCPLAHVRTWVNPFNAHFPHVPLDRFAVDLDSFELEVSRDLSRSIERTCLSGMKEGPTIASGKVDYSIEGRTIRTDLANADLHKAKLTCADMRYSNLRGANLTDADLNETVLDYADLREVVITEEQLKMARSTKHVQL